MKLIIAGSRSITLEPEEINQILADHSVWPTEVVSGTAAGVDRSGEKFAHAYGVPVAEFPADWNGLGKKAGHIRNNQMAAYGDALLLIWDGQSPGSKGMKRDMVKWDKPVYEIIMKPNQPEYSRKENYFQFGKHKGECIENVPGEYLIWCLSNIELKNKDFKLKIEEELKSRLSK